jgi:hypothetical protein
MVIARCHKVLWVQTIGNDIYEHRNHLFFENSRLNFYSK